MKKLPLYFFSLPVLFLSILVSRSEAQMSDNQFEHLMETVKNAEDAAWRTIPWQISLLEAQRIAARERKPIFIWAMDGHPLGCT